MRRILQVSTIIFAFVLLVFGVVYFFGRNDSPRQVTQTDQKLLNTTGLELTKDILTNYDANLGVFSASCSIINNTGEAKTVVVAVTVRDKETAQVVMSFADTVKVAASQVPTSFVFNHKSTVPVDLDYTETSLNIVATE